MNMTLANINRSHTTFRNSLFETVKRKHAIVCHAC